MRVVLNKMPYQQRSPAPESSPPSDVGAGTMVVDEANKVPLFERGQWPSFWVGHPERMRKPFVLAFRRRFSLTSETRIRVHVTADERYELFLNGRLIGRGSERGDPNLWFFETFDWLLPAGEHVVAGIVFALGEVGIRAQMSLEPGFLLSPDTEEQLKLLGTGVAEWEVKEIEGYTFERPFSHDFFSVGYNTVFNGNAFPWGVEKGMGENWRPARRLLPGTDAARRNRYPPTHLLQPAIVPEMLNLVFRNVKIRFVEELAKDGDPGGIPVDPDAHLEAEERQWDRLVRGEAPLIVPPRTSRRVILECAEYLCAYPQVSLSAGAGAFLRIHWAESLFVEPNASMKGHRSEIERKFFTGAGDAFIPDGGTGRNFEPPFWRAGRYIEVVVRTADEELRIEDIAFRETRYPMEPASWFKSSDPRMAALIPIVVRTLQASAHDSFMDGPYYEQMMWAGDGVQTGLAHFVLTPDDRLVKKWLRLFDSSRLLDGLTRARWPARDTMIIPSFSLYWVQMLHHYAFWRSDPALVRARMPGVRAVLDAFLAFLNDEGLLEISRGWNFVDWVPEWSNGTPPGADGEVNAILNWQFVWVLQMVAELEELNGEPELADRARRLCRKVSAAAESVFWNRERRLFADDRKHKSFSEHAQSFAVLSGALSSDKLAGIALADDSSLTRATISFTHFVFEAVRKIGRPEVIFSRLQYWYDLEKTGFITLPEGPEPSRSDCHGWGAHPLYHYFASILGIRPAAPQFASVEIAPQMGPLKHASGRMPHPQGEILVDLSLENDILEACIVLPDGVDGRFSFAGKIHPLAAGNQTFKVSGNVPQEFTPGIR